jgi:hypothetical protein
VEYLRDEDWQARNINLNVKTVEENMQKKNPMVGVRERTILTERPPLVGVVITNFLRIEGATWSA